LFWIWQFVYIKLSVAKLECFPPKIQARISKNVLYVPCPNGDQALGPLEQAFAWLGSKVFVFFAFFFLQFCGFKVTLLKNLFVTWW
jgi:hypothetical protein